MKRFVGLILTVLMLLSAVPIASAASVESNVYFEDGSFISTGYGSPEDYWESLDGVEESGGSVSFIKRIIDLIKAFIEKLFGKVEPENQIHTVSRTKYAAYYDSKGELLWTVYLTASFTFDGVGSECTAVSTRSDIKDGDWKLLSAESDKSESTAKGTFVMKQYKLGVPLKEIERVLTLTCDEKGNVK